MLCGAFRFKGKTLACDAGHRSSSLRLPPTTYSFIVQRIRTFDYESKNSCSNQLGTTYCRVV
jgi:hypothetical protein